MNSPVGLLFIISMLTMQTGFAQATKESKVELLKQRVYELEQQQEKLDDFYLNFYMLGKGRVSPFSKTQLSIGGYFDTSIVDMNGPGMDRQISANNHSYGLNVSAELSEKITFAAQTQTITIAPLFNANNNPNLTPPKRQFNGMGAGSLVTQGYLEYRPSDLFNIQSGIGYIPFGIAYSQRELVLFHQRNGPQVIQNDDGYNIMVASPLWIGLHFYGQFPTEKRMGYHVYTLTPGSNVKSVGFGGRYWVDASEMMRTGFSFQYGEREMGSYLTHAFDISLKYQDFGILAEYITTENSGVGKDNLAYYIEPYYNFLNNKWLVYTIFEYLRSLEQVDIATLKPDAFEKMCYGAGVNWIPLPIARIRLGYLRHDYLHDTDSINGQKRDYETFEFSTALAF